MNPIKTEMLLQVSGFFHRSNFRVNITTTMHLCFIWDNMSMFASGYTMEVEEILRHQLEIINERKKKSDRYAISYLLCDWHLEHMTILHRIDTEVFHGA